MQITKSASYPLGMFDLIKGIGMMFVVLFHSLSFADVSGWIVCAVWSLGYMMSCFFSVSGFQFRPGTVKQTAKRYAKTYLPMYLRLAAAVLLFMLIRRRESLLSYLVGFSLGVFYPKMAGTFYIGGIGLGWFVLGLLWGSILLSLVLKIKNSWVRAICVLVLTALRPVFDTEQTDYFCLYRALEALPAMYVGYCMYSRNLLSANETGWKRILPYCLAVLMIPSIFSESDAWWMGAVVILGDLIWSYAAICFSRDTVHKSGVLLELIRKIGRYTPWIITIHGMEMLCFEWDKIITKFSFIPNEDLKFLALVVLRVVIIWVGCAILARIDRLEKQWKRKRRSQKRAQKKATA